MSVSEITHRVTENRRRVRGLRQSERAIANAPTVASRQELEALSRR